MVITMTGMILLDETELLYVAVHGISNARGAFDKLESKLTSLKGRKFFGHFNPETEEYRACVARIAADPQPETINLLKWTVPKGKYIYEKIEDWNKKTSLIAPTFARMIKQNLGTIDWSRPLLEYYKSLHELRLLIPISG